MASMTSSSVTRQIKSLFESGSVTGLSDRQLLERFNSRRDPIGEAAFAALVSRHGPMVLEVSRQVLGGLHDAEDAFQAVFLVLARRALSIRDPDLLANWLYGVTVRTARCAKLEIERRRKRERGSLLAGAGAAVEATVHAAEKRVIDREQADVLLGEIERLPSSFRLPVVLCYFEGLTIDEAARRLCWPIGTVRSRLARAREKLRRGLTRRGVLVPAAVLTAGFCPRSASASLSVSLCEITIRAALKSVAGESLAGAASAFPVALAEGVLRSMLGIRLKLIASALLLLGAVAAGAGFVAQPPVRQAAKPGMQERQAGKPNLQRIAAPPGDAKSRPAPAPGRMFVIGRVLDPDGKPVNGAAVDLVGIPRTPWVGASVEGYEFTALGLGETDAGGRFRVEATRTSSANFRELSMLAAAPGRGIGWANLNPDAEQPGGEIQLRADEVVRARLVDINGRPASGVEVHINRMVQKNGDKGNGDHDAVSLSENPPAGLRAWPRPVKTDGDGRLVITGIARGFSVSVTVRDPRFARQDLVIEPPGRAASKEATLALEPARIIEGAVVAADTGKPIPNAVVSVRTLVKREHVNGFFTAKFRADAAARFKLNPIAGDEYTLGAFPTGGEPYLIQQDELKWVKGAVRATHDIKLPRGVSIRGKVTEHGTARPLPGSSIQFIPTRDDDEVLSGWQATVVSQNDGSFQIAVTPGKGHLLVFGPTPDYILEEIGSKRLYDQGPGGQRERAHDIISYEVKAGDPPHIVGASVRPGVTIKGHVEGPNGQTVADAHILTALHIDALDTSWRGNVKVRVRDGRFELHGLAPDSTTRIFVLDPAHKWGGSLEISGRQASDSPTVRLEPCGQARARIVGPDGKAIANYTLHFEFVMTPGPSQWSQRKQDRAELAADADFIANVDHKNYPDMPRTDAEGRITLPALIPGALYRILDFSTVNDQDKGAQIRKDFTVKPGATLDLGDILIEKPKA
jgi:RNA polymerase sigma factor (sigma-70 family)